MHLGDILGDYLTVDLGAKTTNLMTCLVLSLILGFALGLEREFANKWAGLRTHIMVCVGSCVFTILSIYGFPILMSDSGAVRDSARVAAQILTGIGFIGGGTVLRHGSSISGLTTAATLWVAAAIGMAAGCGMYWLAIISTVFSVGVLILNRIFERNFLSKYSSKCMKKLKVSVTCPVSVSDDAYQIITESFSTITEINRKKYDKDTYQSKIVFVFESREKHPIQFVNDIIGEIKELTNVSIVELND